MSWIFNGQVATAEQLQDVRPFLSTEQVAFAEQCWLEEQLPAQVLELCRLRIAQLYQCDAELAMRREEAVAAGLTENKISRLSHWFEDTMFTEWEKACIEAAELYAQSPPAITEALAAEIIDLMGEPAYIALLDALAVFNGFALQGKPIASEA